MDYEKSNFEQNINPVLIAEFSYLAQTAFQANEDRARVTNYYVVTMGAAVAAIIGVRIEPTFPTDVYWGFSTLFGALGIIGLLTLLQIVRLRRAWIESVLAMNAIKDYYKTHFPDPIFVQAFAWNRTTIPKAAKHWSVAFLLAVSVMLIDSLAFAVTIIYMGLAMGTVHNSSWLVFAAITGIAAALIQYHLYNKLLEI